MNSLLRRYSVAILTPAAAAGAPLAELLAGARKPISILEIEVSLTAATASSIGLIRQLAVGTQTNALAPNADDETADAAQARLASTWSAAPTIAASPVYKKRIVLPATVGAVVRWTWDKDRPLVVRPNQSLLLWNFGAGADGICAASFVFDE